MIFDLIQLLFPIPSTEHNQDVGKLKVPLAVINELHREPTQDCSNVLHRAARGDLSSFQLHKR